MVLLHPTDFTKLHIVAEEVQVQNSVY